MLNLRSLDYNWLPWKFRTAPDGFWDDEGCVLSYFDWLAERLKIQHIENWYDIGSEDFEYGSTLMGRNGGTYSVLTRYFPGKFCQK
jgi:hypothetical protein